MKFNQQTLLLFSILGCHSILAANEQKINDFWFNGAEINRYDLTQARYGQQHPGHAEFIFVTEPFLTDQQVKQEYGNGLATPVLKLNALRTFNTGIYSYRTMASTFRPIDLATYPHALKSTTSIQDWCGQAFQQINRTQAGWQVEVRSYFQNAGDASYQLADAWLEDELWLLARLAPKKLPIGEFNMLPGSLYLRFNHQPIATQTAKGSLSVTDSEYVYSVIYPNINRMLTLHLDREFPHIIRKWIESDPQGTTTALLKDRIMNSYYWSENGPGDRVKRKELGLAPVAD